MVGTYNNLAKRLSLFSAVLMMSLTIAGCQKEASPNENVVSDNTDVKAEAEADVGASEHSIPEERSVKSTSNLTTLTPSERVMATLSQHRWMLTSATDANEQPLTEFLDIENQVTLSFNEYQGQPTLSYSVG